MLPAIFVYKPFFQNKVFQVCPCLVFVVILLLFISVGAASSNFTWDRVVCSYCFTVTLRGFSASKVGLVHHIDYVPLQTKYMSNFITNICIQSFNWYLVLHCLIKVWPQLRTYMVFVVSDCRS